MDQLNLLGRLPDPFQDFRKISTLFTHCWWRGPPAGLAGVCDVGQSETIPPGNSRAGTALHSCTASRPQLPQPGGSRAAPGPALPQPGCPTTPPPRPLLPPRLVGWRGGAVCSPGGRRTPGLLSVCQCRPSRPSDHTVTVPCRHSSAQASS